MKSHCIYGPPGTGKTTKLMSLLTEVLHRNSAKDVMFLSHTKAAAREVLERSGARLPAQNISTIHALCYRACGLSREQVVNYEKLRAFSEISGIPITGQRINADDAIEEGDEYLSIVSFARNRKISYEEAYYESDRPGTFDNFSAFCHEYDDWKQSYGLRDFDDMLELSLGVDCIHPARAVFVDEAQDLSPLQWDVLSNLLRTTKLSYVAGDDDQAIYVWGGAKPDGMAEFEERYSAARKILDQSYRVPSEVHALAQGVISRVRDRVDKVYKPRDERGIVTRSAFMEGLTGANGSFESDGETLFLYRDLGGKDEVHDYLMESGTPFLTRTGFPGPLQNKFGRCLKAIYNNGPIKDVRNALTESGNRLLSKYDDDHTKLQKHHFSEFLYIPSRELEWYYDEVDFTATPKVFTSTIHGAKGAEADHVVLHTKMSGKTEASYDRDPDQEHRVWYVAATRAKHRLTIVEGEQGYQI